MKTLDKHLEYKGYIGEIIYDDCPGTLRARVINSGPYPIADAEAWDVESLKVEFAISIDIYLEACEEDGDPPIPPGEIVDHDALDEAFHRDPPEWYRELMDEFQTAEPPAESARTV